MAEAYLGLRFGSAERDDCCNEVWTESAVMRFFSSVPHPADAGNDDIASYIDAFESVASDATKPPLRDLPTDVLFRRLLDFTPCPIRDGKLIALALTEPRFLREESLLPVIRNHGPIAGTDLPEVDRVIGLATATNVVEAYRALGGAEADRLLRRWIVNTTERDRSHLLALCRHDDLLDEGARAHVRNVLKARPFPELLWLRRELPWVLDEDEVAAYANGAVDDPHALWRLVEVSGQIAVAALERLEQHRPEECVHLIDELMKCRTLEGRPTLSKQAALQHLVSVAADHPVSQEAAKLVEMLPSAAAWAQYGEDVAQAMLRFGSGSSLYDLVRSVVAKAQPGAGTTIKLLTNIHQAVATACLNTADEAFEKGDLEGVHRALVAIAELRPPTRFKRRLHAFRTRHSLSEELDEIVRINERLVGGKSTDPPTVDDVHHALVALREVRS